LKFYSCRRLGCCFSHNLSINYNGHCSLSEEHLLYLFGDFKYYTNTLTIKSPLWSRNVVTPSLKIKNNKDPIFILISNHFWMGVKLIPDTSHHITCTFRCWPNNVKSNESAIVMFRDLKLL
jgi:hypothetical protein